MLTASRPLLKLPFTGSFGAPGDGLRAQLRDWERDLEIWRSAGPLVHRSNQSKKNQQSKETICHGSHLVP